MRILTVRQPWAWAIIHGGKDVENRSRNIAGDYRGLIAIHSGLTFDDPPLVGPLMAAHQQARYRDGLDWGARQSSRRSQMPVGAIIGVVDLVDVHQGPNTEQDHFRAVRSCFQPGRLYGLCAPWAEQDAWHLVLANPRALAEPIPFRGALGLRTLDDETTARVLGAIA